MPLRDHFRPPVSKRSSWEGFHGMWPAVIVQHLRSWLPAGFVAEPRGCPEYYDCADEPFVVDTDDALTTSWRPPPATRSVETELPDLDEYEVRIYDVTSGRRLVAAVEIVSPANKGRAEHRTAFVGKCAALLRQGVAVSIVDLVTVRQFNLYAELLESIGHADIDPTLTDPPPHLVRRVVSLGAG